VDAYDVRDALEWFLLERARGTADEGANPFSDAAAYVVVEAFQRVLGQGEPEACAVFDVGGDVWTAIVINDSLSLVQINGGTVEVRFVGHPLGGTYSEFWELAETGEGRLRIVGKFEHEHLPGPLELRIEPVAHGAYQGLEALRAVFRRWAETLP